MKGKVNLKTTTIFEVDQLLEVPQSSGIDEVGRGCLAGPVVVACVTWDHKSATGLPWFHQLTDSKKLDATRRAELFKPILEAATRVRVAVLSHMMVDLLNILRATLHGFELVAPTYDDHIPLFLDGNQRPPGLPWGRTLVKGDSRQSAVAAASVVAKVTRDALMVRLDRQTPGYGFARHMGYATKMHRDAIASLGPGLYHRKSFAPVANQCAEPVEADETWLNKAKGAEHATLGTTWEAFCRAYPSLSLEGARRVMKCFHERGLQIIPTPKM